MLKVEILDAAIERSTINGRNGSFTSERQFAWITLPSGERRRVRVRIQDGKAHPVGEYSIGDGSFIVSQYGDLQLGALELLPIVKNLAAAPGAAKLAG